MMFFNFLNFFAIFFGILSLESGKNDFEWEKFYLSFSASHDLFWLEMKAGWCFSIFEFFAIFLGILKLESGKNVS